MNKRLLFISLALALVLTILVPATALAAKPVPLEASGTINYISPGAVFPAGNSDRWRVAERELTGELSGDISGDFTMTYKANVESVVTQAGNLHGTLEAGDYVLKVNGKIQPLEFVGWYIPPGTPGYPDGVPYLKITISGHWAFTEGARGQGEFDAWVIFIPTSEGHVGYIVNSAFDLSGQWQPPE